MSKYLIAGSPGSGKSTVIRELCKRGATAYDTDSYPGATLLEDKQGKHVDFPAGFIDWDLYNWNWQERVILELLESDKTVFLGGVAFNTAQFYSHFDKIFILTLDLETLKSRILKRTDKDYGKHPEQLVGILDYHKILQAELESQPNAVLINSMDSLEKVVNSIQELAK